MKYTPSIYRFRAEAAVEHHLKSGRQTSNLLRIDGGGGDTMLQQMLMISESYEFFS